MLAALVARNQQLLAASLAQRGELGGVRSPAVCWAAARPGRRAAADARHGHERMACDAAAPTARPAAAAAIDPPLLTAMIKRCDDWEELRALQQQHGAAMNALHMAAMLTHAAQLAGGTPGPAPPPQERADWALALLQQAEAIAPQLSPRQASNVLWAAARLGVQPPSGCLDALLGAVRLGMPDAGGQDLANALWALSALPETRTPDGTWLAAYWERSEAVLAGGGCGAQELCSSAYAAAALHLSPPPSWAAALLRAARPLLSELTPQGHANLLWALARLHSREALPPGWLQQLLAASQPLLPRFSTPQLASSLWAVAQLAEEQGAPPAAWLQAFAGAAATQLRLMEPQGLANTAAALHVLLQHGGAGCTADPGSGDGAAEAEPAAAAADTCSQLLQNVQAAAAQLGGQRLGPRDAAALAWAAGSMQAADGSGRCASALLPWAPDYLAACEARLSSASAAELTQQLWVAAKAACVPSSEWLAAYCSEAEQQLPGASPSQLAQLTWCAAVLEGHVAGEARDRSRYRLRPARAEQRQPALPAEFVGALLAAMQAAAGGMAPAELLQAAVGAAQLAPAHQLPTGLAEALAAAATAQPPPSRQQQVSLLLAIARLSSRQARQAAPARASSLMQPRRPAPAAQQAGHDNAGHLQQLASAAAERGARQGGLQAGDASRLAWALAAAGYSPPVKQQQALLTAALQQPAQLSHSQLTAALRAAAAWRCALPAATWQQLQQGLQATRRWPPQQLCKLLAMAALHDRQPAARQLCDQLWRQLQRQLQVAGSDAPLEALWLLAWLRARVPPEWLQELLYDTQPALAGCSLMQLLQAAQALALLQVPPGGARDSFLQQLLAAASQLLAAPRAAERAQHARLLPALLTALARLRAQPPGPWMGACTDALVAELPACDADAVVDSLSALAVLGYRPGDDQLDALLARCQQLLGSMPARQLRTALWACARLQALPPDAWLEAFYGRVEAGEVVGALDVSSFVAIAWALARLGAVPDPAWLRRLLDAVSDEQLTGWTPQALANAICAFTKLRFNPGQGWLARFGEAVGMQAGAGALQQLDRFHIEWAWRELHDSAAAGAAPAAGRHGGGTPAAQQ